MTTKPLRAKAFHPQTMGVIYPCVVITPGRKGTQRVKFFTSIRGKEQTFTLPTSHIFPL